MRIRRAGLLLVTVALFAQNSGQGPFRTSTPAVSPGTSLAIYAVKGPALGINSVVMVDSDQLLESVIGNPTYCVLVDGSSQPCASGSSGSVPNFSDAETPSGSVNGSNTEFALANVPSPAASLILIRNGLVMTAAVDYTLTGNAVTFINGEVPQSGDVLRAWYRF